MSEPQHAEPAIARRALWLLVVPIAAALLPWLLLRVADANPGGLGLLVVASVPLMGALGALSFSFVAPVRMLPLVPYVVAAAAFLFVLLVASDITSGNKLDFGPAQVIGVIMPVLAVAGGIVSYLWLPEPEPEWEAEQEQELES